MPSKSRRNRRKSKYVTKRGLPFQLMKYAETKYIVFADSDVSLPNPSSTLSNINLVNIREGTGLNERVGQQIQITGVHIKIIFKGANSNDLRFFRAMLWTPRISDDSSPPVLDMVNTAQFEEHTVWADKLAIAPLAEASTPGGVYTFKKKFKPYLKTMYTTALGEDVSKGMLRLLMLPKADLSVVVSWNAKVYFKDI